MPDWRKDLKNFFDETEKEEQERDPSGMTRFIAQVAVPALQKVGDELTQHGRDVDVRNAGTSAAIVVRYHGEEEMTYRLQGRTFPNGTLPFADIRCRQRKGLKLVRVESMVRSGNPDYSIDDITEDEIIANFLQHYKRRVQ